MHIDEAINMMREHDVRNIEDDDVHRIIELYGKGLDD